MAAEERGQPQVEVEPIELGEGLPLRGPIGHPEASKGDTPTQQRDVDGVEARGAAGDRLNARDHDQADQLRQREPETCGRDQQYHDSEDEPAARAHHRYNADASSVPSGCVGGRQTDHLLRFGGPGPALAVRAESSTRVRQCAATASGCRLRAELSRRRRRSRRSSSARRRSNPAAPGDDLGDQGRVRDDGSGGVDIMGASRPFPPVPQSVLADEGSADPLDLDPARPARAASRTAPSGGDRCAASVGVSRGIGKAPMGRRRPTLFERSARPY